jgi:hypothetical protein
MRDRQVILDVAGFFHKEMHDAKYYPIKDENHNDQVERMLVEAVEKAKAELASHRRGRAMRIALDQIMPGWVYIDASNDLPKEKWGTFVSDSPVEWFEWLTKNGVRMSEASKLVDNAFPAGLPNRS